MAKLTLEQIRKNCELLIRIGDNGPAQVVNGVTLSLLSQIINDLALHVQELKK